MENELRKEKQLQTKVSLKTGARLEEIAKRTNVTVFKFLQVTIDCFIKVFCEREPISDEMREIFYKFTDFDRAKNGFCFTERKLFGLTVSKCLAIVSKRNTEVPEVVLLEKDGEQMTQNQNRDEILKVFLQAFSPKILRGLQSITQKEQLHNLSDALFFAISETATEPGEVLHDEIKELFEEANNITYTASPEFGTQKNVDNMPQSRFEMKPRKRPYALSFETQERIRERQKQKEDCETVQYFEDLQQFENIFEEC